jgi:nitroimidazol reductase NimA-like FMN-containing flavoprotein (pyridoxamine 5'-phosphate oxidase superfamily)
MRQAKKEIREKETIIEMLNICPVGRLGTVGKDGYPRVKPLNFAYHDDKIYFHTAIEGEKIEDIKRDNRVCFEVDLPIAFVKSTGSPCRAHYLYRSVVIKGRAHIVEDASERLFALTRLMKKYQPEGGYGAFPEDTVKITGVVGIDIEEMAGKEDLGKDQMKEHVLKALEEKVQLPITLERT